MQLVKRFQKIQEAKEVFGDRWVVLFRFKALIYIDYSRLMQPTASVSQEINSFSLLR
jgi:hypothetical protein